MSRSVRALGSYPWTRRIWEQTRWLVSEFRQDWSRNRVGGLSAEIAFFAILGLLPAVIVFAATLGWLDSVIGKNTAAPIEEWLLERVTEIFGTENTLRETTSDLFQHSSAGLITVGVLISGYAASRGFIAVVRALEVVYESERSRSWISTRIAGIVLTLVTLIVAALIVAMVVVGPLLGIGEELAERVGAGSAFVALWVWLRGPVAFVVMVAWTASVYRFVPLTRTPWKMKLPGALVGALWWLAASWGFRIYIETASSGVNVVFGVLGGALTLLLWLYLLSMGLLVGAVVNHVLIRWTAQLKSIKPS